jgi:protein involved in polysaccharide export with SLBB domain
MPSVISRISFLAVGVVTLCSASVSLGQSPPAANTARTRSYESRGELETQVKAASAAGRSNEAWLLRTRLEKGDFQEGDRVIVAVQGASGDTMVVRAGKVLQFPGMDDMPLEGLLRSELETKLSAHLAKYLRDPSVRATPLVRLGVIGRITRPGFYYTAPDVILPDVIMLAGGPGQDADLNKITIRRGATIIWNAVDTRTALSEGISLDRLHLRAGDEIEIGVQRRFQWTAIIPTVTGALALIISLVQLAK